MSNHSDDCKFCGADQRGLGSMHEKGCPSYKIRQLQNELIFNAQLSEWDRKKIRSEIRELEEYGNG